MRTLIYIAALGVVMAFAAWAYQVNYKTQEAVRHLEDLHHQIAEERAAIAMLKAEWAYLNRPDRLRELAEAHFEVLGLMPMNSEHFGTPGLVTYPTPDEEIGKLLSFLNPDEEDAE